MSKAKTFSRWRQSTGKDHTYSADHEKVPAMTRYTKHAEDHKTINEVLSGAGWTPDPIRSETADLGYRNERATLRVVLASRSPGFNLSVEEGEKQALVHVDFGDELLRVLNKLVEVQDKFVYAAAEEIMEALYPATREIFVYVNDELVPIQKAGEDLELEREKPEVFFDQRLVELQWYRVDGRTFEREGPLAFRLKLAENNDSIYVLFGLGAPGQIAVIAYPEGRWNDLLMLVTAWAAKVTKDNYDSFLKELIREFPQTFLFERGEVFLLTDDAPTLPLG